MILSYFQKALEPHATNNYKAAPLYPKAEAFAAGVSHAIDLG
jgi:hypothetical protein